MSVCELAVQQPKDGQTCSFFHCLKICSVSLPGEGREVVFLDRVLRGDDDGASAVADSARAAGRHHAALKGIKR